jgi:hypothetical protein
MIRLPFYDLWINFEVGNYLEPVEGRNLLIASDSYCLILGAILFPRSSLTIGGPSFLHKGEKIEMRFLANKNGAVWSTTTPYDYIALANPASRSRAQGKIVR